MAAVATTVLQEKHQEIGLLCYYNEMTAAYPGAYECIYRGEAGYEADEMIFYQIVRREDVIHNFTVHDRCFHHTCPY